MECDSDNANRLVDDAFAKICDRLNDSSVQVRTEAARLMVKLKTYSIKRNKTYHGCSIQGLVKGVSPEFLMQTLDKKLMSNMRVIKSTNVLVH